MLSLIYVCFRFFRFFPRKTFAYNLTAVKELIEEGYRAITPGEWARCVAHVESVEWTYWENEISVEAEIESIMIDLASDSDYSSDTNTASETEN